MIYPSVQAKINAPPHASAAVKKLTAGAKINVKTVSASGSIEIAENGLYDITGFATANVNVPVPSNYGEIIWNGTTLTVR